MVKKTAALLMVLHWTTAAGAEQLQPAEAVTLVQATLQNAGIVDAQPVAPSRPLPDCTAQVSVIAPTGDWSTVTVQCDHPFWKRSVRTKSRASNGGQTVAIPRNDAPALTVLGLAKSLPKGAMLSADDLVQVSVSDLGPDQVFTDPKNVIGRRLERSVGAGNAILARHLEPDWKVLSGQKVVILTRGPGIQISMQGRAKMNGAVGDIISIENLGSGRTISARVIQEDIVEVTLKPFENGS